MDRRIDVATGVGPPVFFRQRSFIPVHNRRPLRVRRRHVHHALVAVPIFLVAITQAELIGLELGCIGTPALVDGILDFVVDLCDQVLLALLVDQEGRLELLRGAAVIVFLDVRFEDFREAQPHVLQTDLVDRLLTFCHIHFLS